MGIIRPQPLRIGARVSLPISMITFYRDKDNQYIYYPENHRGVGDDVYLNNSIAFNPKRRCTLEEPRALQRVVSRGVIVGYRNTKTDEQIEPDQYNKRLETLESIGDDDITVEEEVELRRLQREWEEVVEEVETREDVPFKIVDIDYPADIRLLPLQHFAKQPEQINQFEINGEQIALDYAHKLCQEAGLRRRKTERHKSERGTYYLDEDFYWWRIEGENYGERGEMNEFSKKFVGSLSDCEKRIAEIETYVQSIFDSWAVALIDPGHLTVKWLDKRVRELKYQIECIDPKVKTRSNHQRALKMMEEMVEWVKEKAQEKLAAVSD